MKKTPEQFLSDVKKRWGNEYEILHPSQYINAHSKMDILHNVCGRECVIEANSFLQGHGCPKCAYSKAAERKIKKYKEIFVNRLPEHIYPITDYKGSKEKMSFGCKVCNETFITTPDDFSNVMKFRCPNCTKIETLKKLRKDSNKYARDFYSVHKGKFEIVEGYVRQIDKIKIKCLKCGTEFYKLPLGALSPKMRCRYCDWGIKSVSFDELKKVSREEYFIISKNFYRLKDKIEVIHNRCNKKFSISVESFLKGVDCPYCSNRIITQEVFKKRCKENLGEDYEVLSPFMGDNKKVKIRHIKCGNIYYTNASNIRACHGCPRCKQSKGEKKISEFLIKNNQNFIPQKTFAWTNPKKYRYDFYLPEKNLIIEYNGSQHYVEAPFFRNTLKEQKKIDREKRKLAIANGYDYLVISYKDYEKIEKILKEKIGGKI